MIIKTDPRIVSVQVSDKIRVALADGREIAIPLLWSPRLQKASPEQRSRTEVSPSGKAIHWPDVDEDIEISAFFSRGEIVVFPEGVPMIKDDGSLQQATKPGVG